MTNAPTQDTRSAWQALETDRLLGVNFMVINPPMAKANASMVPMEKSAENIVPPVSAPILDLSMPVYPAVAAKIAALAALRARHDLECRHCTGVDTHTQTVFGEGDPNASLMFIGEAPGEEEDRTGRPFVGRAGQKLDEIIKAVGYSREQVYIANILKSRPPENRTPLPNEIDLCAPFLAEQIRIVGPQVIVALGNPATKWLLHTNQGITKIRGQWAVYENKGVKIPVMPTFHPAYLLRNYTVETRKQVWSDMKEAVAKIKK